MPDYSTDTKPTDRPDRLDLRSQSPVDDRLAAMRELFPEVFREGKIDLESLQRSLGEWVDPGKERFGFTWPGKAACMKLIQQPSVATLRPDAAGSVDFDTTQNLIIEGDNLEVLKLLQRSYHGKVKMIYIDPPYNTGNDFVYLDDFAEPLQNYLRMSGQADVKGQRLTTNSDASGRYHSNWLNMIYSRLYLARNLLRDDGVIFVSIDDTELPALRAVMNELFGEENFIGIIVWKKKTNGNNMGFIPPVHDYIVCYGRFASEDSILGFPVSKDSIERNYSNPDNDPRGPWTITDLSANHKGPHFPITNPNTGATFYPPNGRYWALGEKDVEKKIREGRIIFGRSGTGRPVQRKFLSERSSLRVKAESWWDRHGLNADGSLELSELIGEAKVFSHPKPTATISHLVNIGSRANENDIVLDFFAGSGTTGHAVMRLNAEDGGNRRFILVQLPEPLEEPKRLDDGTELRTIADICRERVRRAGQQIAVKQFGKENTPPPRMLA